MLKQAQLTKISHANSTSIVDEPGILSTPFYIFLGIIHVFIGLLAYQRPIFATLHAFVTIAIGIWVAMMPYPMTKVANAAAYIAGTELLWRMTGASVFWEIGKYGVILIALLALFRMRVRQIPVVLFLFGLFLLPAVFPVLMTFDLAQIHGRLSNDATGPAAIVLTAWFFSQITLSNVEVRNLLLWLALPVASIAAIVTFSLFTSNISWTFESNFAASGGYGPNQVSTALGLGATALVLLVLVFSNRLRLNDLVIFLGLSLWIISAAFITFSRGGVITSLIAIVAALFVSWKNFRSSSDILRVLFWILIMLSIFTLFIWPYFVQLTGDKIVERYNLAEDTSGTNRVNIAQHEIELFLQHPLSGVGIGNAGGSHTEYTRLLAEHGILGLLILLLYPLIFSRNYFRLKNQPSLQMLAVGVMVWGLAYMLHSQTRTVAPAFMLGIAFANFNNDQAHED